ncbi:MAG: hypothetical protein AUG48_00135 [Actinobacteria bacterium 13_1_20CM_3_68_9]|nr:MAG: hypothetical protein AUG48_00135 [Actinobacteria bacterium 13_1_20CM_3_68_9]
MRQRRGLAAAAALVCAAAAAGCGFGPGPSSAGTATLTVTRDYGSKTLVDGTETDPHSSETVLRFLDREADITTRYGGGFVQSIDGLAGAEHAGRPYDWFFYVNGIESPVGSAEVHVHGGDRIWWDYRDWSSAMRVPAVVGSWPEPFAQASAGAPHPVLVDCLAGGSACHTTANRLADAGVSASVERGKRGPSQGTTAPRLLVGPWGRVRSDPAVDELRGGPGSTGVFAAFKRPSAGGYHLIALDSAATPVRDLGPDAGLVAALRSGDQAPTWVIPGSSGSAVRRAASSLRPAALRDRYAVAVPSHGSPVPLPVDRGGDG